MTVKRMTTDGKTESIEKKIIQNTNRKGQTEPLERVIKPPKTSGKQK